MNTRPSYDELLRKSDRLQSSNDKLVAENKKLGLRIKNLEDDFKYFKSTIEAVLDTKDKTIKELTTENNRLKHKLGENSNNSNTPPSSEMFPPKQRSLRKKSNNKTGGQPGHKGSTLAQIAEPDETILIKPKKCDNCGSGLEKAETKGREVRQVFDIPKIVMHCTEYKALRLKCANCNHITKGNFPKNVTNCVQYGKNFSAYTLYLNSKQFITLNRMCDLFEVFTGQRPSQGTINSIIKTGASILDEKFAPGIKKAIKNSQYIHADETTLNAEGLKCWLHSYSNEFYAFMVVNRVRGHKAIREIGILPNTKAIIIHDACSMYFRYGTAHQLCLAHLLRELQSVEDLDKEYKLENCPAFQISAKIQALIHDSNFGNPTDQLIKTLKEVCLKANEIAASDSNLISKQKALFRRIVKRFDWYVLFAKVSYISPTNNEAESQIRIAKIKQKVSTGFRTLGGAQNFAILNSYIQTARKQGKNVFDALSSICTNHIWLPPSLCRC